MDTEQHVLVVTADPDDPENLTYEIECPGVSDTCRQYLDCVAGDAEQVALEQAADDDRPRMSHGKRHLKIDGTWMAETDFCYVQGHDRLPDSVVGRFPVGRHPIGWDVGDGTEIEVYAITESNVIARLRPGCSAYLTHAGT